MFFLCLFTHSFLIFPSDSAPDFTEYALEVITQNQTNIGIAVTAPNQALGNRENNRGRSTVYRENCAIPLIYEGLIYGANLQSELMVESVDGVTR